MKAIFYLSLLACFFMLCMKESEAISCNSQCDSGTFSSLGTCNTTNGRCVCAVGFTGPNAAYFQNAQGDILIEADFCSEECFYEANITNCQCAKCPFNCDPRCTWPTGQCRTDGQCNCSVDFSGPNATFIVPGKQIVANFCDAPCNYNTTGFPGLSCLRFNDSNLFVPNVSAIANTPDDPIEANKPNANCDPNCGTGDFSLNGQCLPNGDCLCTEGFTGPNARFILEGPHKGLIAAQRCDQSKFVVDGDLSIKY